jgi:hypothetical protein
VTTLRDALSGVIAVNPGWNLRTAQHRFKRSFGLSPSNWLIFKEIS